MSNFKYQISNGITNSKNWKLQIVDWKFPKGFTLVELMISSAIFISVSTIVVAVLFNTFRLSQRTEIILAVKNNGNTALSQMANTLKYAATLDDPVSCIPTASNLQTVTITSSIDNEQTTLTCATGANSSIASNGATLINNDAVTVQTCSFTCSQTTINDPPTITIKFGLTSKNYRNTTEAQTLLPFQTTVLMSNLTQ